jgi:uncharacterized protein (TIGR04255 family)
MDEFETFSNPPIAEAMLDIKATLPAGADLAMLAQFHEAVRDRFPLKQERLLQTLQFQTGGNLMPVVGVQGYLFRSADDTKVVQAKLDGFTFNKLKPYGKWESFRREAKELWEKYVALAKPVTVHQIGLRYLNRIGIPHPVKEIRDFFPMFPEIPSQLPQGVSNFFMRMAISDPAPDMAAFITFAMEPFLPESKFAVFILDIEIATVPLSLSPDSETLWTKMDSLRKLKNQAFFSAVTEQTRKLFR